MANNSTDTPPTEAPSSFKDTGSMVLQIVGGILMLPALLNLHFGWIDKLWIFAPVILYVTGTVLGIKVEIHYSPTDDD
jgi:hypothetical protein